MEKKVGICCQCGITVYNRGPPTGKADDVGDYDWICYPCQFEAMDNGTWNELKVQHWR